MHWKFKKCEVPSMQTCREQMDNTPGVERSVWQRSSLQQTGFGCFSTCGSIVYATLSMAICVSAWPSLHRPWHPRGQILQLLCVSISSFYVRPCCYRRSKVIQMMAVRGSVMCRDGTVHIHCFTHAQVRDVKNRICEPSVEIGVMTVLTAPEESSHAEERVVYVVGTVFHTRSKWTLDMYWERRARLFAAMVPLSFCFELRYLSWDIITYLHLILFFIWISFDFIIQSRFVRILHLILFFHMN